MTAFATKADLPKETRAEIDRVSAIASAQRNSVESSFLANLAQYLTNEVVLRNDANEIVIAAGVTLPTGLSGFAKGAFFLKSDAASGTQGLYSNSGSNTSATWNLIGSSEATTPVNAVASTGVLTLTGAIVPGSHAESVLTSDATNVSDGETCTIGSTVYRFKNTTAAAYDVKIGASAAATLDNLKLAINANGAGDGTDYHAGTAAHPTVVATTNTDTTQKVVARVPGTAANTTATTEASAHLSWPAATLGDGTGASNPGVASETVTIGGVVYSFVDVLSETNGAAAIVNQVLFGADSAAALDNLKSAINASAGAGTTYSTGTTAHPTVNATTNTDTAQTIAADTKGTAGDAITTTETLTNGAWGAATLGGGVDGTVGAAGEISYDASYLYVAIAANTVADANWRRISLGSAY